MKRSKPFAKGRLYSSSYIFIPTMVSSFTALTVRYTTRRFIGEYDPTLGELKIYISLVGF